MLRSECRILLFRFTHFLDSGEQALTVIVLFNDIIPRAGGTFLAPDGLKNVVKWWVVVSSVEEGQSAELTDTYLTTAAMNAFFESPSSDTFLRV